MRIKIISALSFCLLSSLWTLAQISQGGAPLFLEYPALRSSENTGFVEMPAFNLDSVLRLDELNKGKMRGSFQFAHKFHTHIEKGKDGNQWVLPGGTKVWQAGIRSKGAYSINLLFTEFHIPEGAKLFIYNTDHSHVIGSFDHRNNSIGRILPVRPVAGDAIIVEYSEPADAAFEGKLLIGEVNHDYRGILRREPEANNPNAFQCMPNVLCDDVDESMVRSTVLLMINGQSACSGTLINNVENDETPYLLTAVHCLNNQLVNGVYKDRDHYISIAGTIVAFFNYNRPVCETVMKATEEMSLAVTYPRAILEKNDIALLEFQEKPPVYYNAYYAGWNVSESANQSPPYTNIHHPGADVKRYGLYSNNIALKSFHPTVFDERSHWRIPTWNTGSTHAGSSGSPLFDNNHLIVGGLSGGDSECNNTNPQKEGDFFFALFKGWTTNDELNKLPAYLDPQNKEVYRMEGFDPNKENPVIRIGNAQYNNGDKLITPQYTAPNNGFLFGNNSLGVAEFAEEFNLSHTSDLFGVFLFVPKMPFSYTSGVEIQVYEGSNGPEQLLATQIFKPQFTDYNNASLGLKDKNMDRTATENFVLFNNPVTVNNHFFIVYKVGTQAGSQFVVYNTQFGTSGTLNTAWLKDNGTWKRANNNGAHSISTSLAIQPLLRKNDTTFIPPAENSEKLKIRYLRAERKLILPDPLQEAGEVSVYDISGRLTQTFPVRKGQKAVELHARSTGSVAIVRIVRGNDVYTGKLIY